MLSSTFTFILLISLMLLLATVRGVQSPMDEIMAEASRSPDGTADIFVRFEPLDVDESVFQSLTTATATSKGEKRNHLRNLLISHAENSQRSLISDLQHEDLEVRSFWINNSLMVRKTPMNIIALIFALKDGDIENEESRNSGDGRGGDGIVEIHSNKVLPHLGLRSRNSNVLNRAGENSAAQHKLHPFLSIPCTPIYSTTTLWSLDLMNVSDAWKYTKGTGVVVGNIDTGVDFLHPLLLPAYRGISDAKSKGGSGSSRPVDHAFNWHDPEGKMIFPLDIHGHGTHTMGTMVGQKGIGIAPEAKWIAAQGCDTMGCSQFRLLSSAEWLLCPKEIVEEEALFDSTLDGSIVKLGKGKEVVRCDLGADVINNSWGGAPEGGSKKNSWFAPALKTWLAADILPIFAMGNEGPDCGTSGSPGDLEGLLGIGSVNKDAALSPFSSRGSLRDVVEEGGGVKPDFVAPGQEVISCRAVALPRGKDEDIDTKLLARMSGTSMASPNAAGVATLLLARARSLKKKFDIYDLHRLLRSSANVAALKEPLAHVGFGGDGEEVVKVCYGKAWSEYPNYHYGHGLLDAGKAMKNL